VAQVTIALALGAGQAPRLTVALEPETLGRVEIRIERGTDGEAASVQVLAERPETLALLQRDSRDLDRALAQAGISVSSGGLQFGLATGGRDQPNQGRPGQGQGQGGGRGPRLPAEVTRPALAILSLLDIAV
jgi:flagellar hook-length control protein FliK